MTAPYYLILGLALLILWFPRNWLRYGRRSKSSGGRKSNQVRGERDPYGQKIRLLEEVVKLRSWVDFFRALVGGWIVLWMAKEQSTADGLPSDVIFYVAAACTLAVLTQLFRLQGRLALFAPIFFLQGLTLGALGPIVGFAAMVLSWALSPLLPSPAALLFIQAGITFSLGFLLNPTEPAVTIILTSVTCLPVVCGLLLQKRLATGFDKKLKIVHRNGSSS
ncbi:MAG: hypothetical protein EAZ36_01420 [Verrucomicrobia bacterium]|nr:MAG: hypothetical protein EAZ36_01420 [Verrucomicrobiota bacterium]